MVSIITPSFGLTDLMYRNGRSKELNVEGHGLNRQNVKAKNTLTNLIRIEISFHLVNLSRWDTTAKRRHRKAIEDAWNNTGKAVAFSGKATEHESKAEYWDKRANTINLSMPESIDFYEHKLEQAKEYHEGVKSGKYPREHAYTLTYAKKAMNEAQKNYELAKRLWGDLH